jgi:hypothetical protein
VYAFIDCLLACVCAIADGVDEGRYPEPEIGADYCEQEPEVPTSVWVWDVFWCELISGLSVWLCAWGYCGRGVR